jgi:methionine sulfoxide reductase catalytic subunit
LIEGEEARPQVFEIDQLIKSFPLEERVYRTRCVEGWSMVIPWVGFPLGDPLKAHLASEISTAAFTFA